MRTALFLNGVYEPILKAQITHGGVNYLQPYKGSIIRMLQENKPDPNSPILVYLSTTTNYNTIAYIAEIVGWEDKRNLSSKIRKLVSENLQACYPDFAAGEIELLNNPKAVNLIAVRNMRECKNQLPTSILTKISDKKPLKPRTRAGGWSEVEDVGFFCALPLVIAEEQDAILKNEVESAMHLSEMELEKRLLRASKVPERINLIVTGFKRNADVIAAVLIKASGICGRCKKNAPFNRKSDGNPFLEVHHIKPLSEGGEDTVENAEAVCPNCHRAAHFG